MPSPLSSVSLPPPTQSKCQSGPKVAGSTALTAVSFLSICTCWMSSPAALCTPGTACSLPTTSDGMALKLVPCTM